ncbi:MAG: LytTR family DNA-binding domain-containing protein [Saprospiraceae bacterium]|nr:LytTR family DNA-binding domain-containing protein [Saprospiraceae bacterium]
MKLRAIIIDDEERSITSLKWELDAFKERVEVIATCTDSTRAKALILKLDPDVVFLDIEMPLLNGIDLIRSFDKVPCSVIFTTAYDQFAVSAFEISAVDYLLKPVDKDDLNRALLKLEQIFDNQQLENKFNTLFENINTTSFKKVVLPVLEGFQFVNVEDIIRCEASGNYTHIHLLKGETLLISKPLKEIELLIADPSFCRVHQSHVVNLRYISKYRKGKGGSLTLDDDTVIPVSRGKRDDFLDLL